MKIIRRPYRLPNWLYARMECLYFAQRRIHRQETSDRMAAQDRALREWADRARAAHGSGNCLAGCPYLHANHEWAR